MRLTSRKRGVLNYFRKKAKHYDDVDYQFYWRLSDTVLWNLLSKLILSRLKNERIKLLDAGAGTGRWGLRIAEELGCKTMLLDISDEMLEVARKKVEKKGLMDLVVTQKGDIEKVEFLGNSRYDLVLLLHNVLSFVDNPKKALINMAKITKKGGYIVVVVANKYHALYFSNVTRQFEELDRVMKENQIKFTKECPPMWTFTPTSLSSLLKRSGFSSIKTYGFPITIYPNMEETTLSQNSKYMKESLSQKDIMEKLIETESEVCLEKEAAARGNMLLAIGKK
jgi:ubiquinone/menaquinone biosynthesis C-methylase UbiE